MTDVLAAARAAYGLADPAPGPAVAERPEARVAATQEPFRASKPDDLHGPILTGLGAADHWLTVPEIRDFVTRGDHYPIHVPNALAALVRDGRVVRRRDSSGQGWEYASAKRARRLAEVAA